MPVRMRRAPSTPKAGSSFVSSTRGSGVAEGVGVVLLEAVGCAEVVGVTVTLTTTGTTVGTLMTELPLLMLVVIDANEVDAERETGEDELAGADELLPPPLLDCPRTGTKRPSARPTRTHHDQERRGYMAEREGDVRGRGKEGRSGRIRGRVYHGRPTSSRQSKVSLSRTTDLHRPPD